MPLQSSYSLKHLTSLSKNQQHRIKTFLFLFIKVIILCAFWQYCNQFFYFFVNYILFYLIFAGQNKNVFIDFLQIFSQKNCVCSCFNMKNRSVHHSSCFSFPAESRCVSYFSTVPYSISCPSIPSKSIVLLVPSLCMIVTGP